MPSRRSLFTLSLLTLIFPLLITAQGGGYDFGHPSPSLPMNTDPAPQYTPTYPVTSQGSYDANPSPNGRDYGSDPSPSPSDPGSYVASPGTYGSKPLSQYIPNTSAPSNPAYGLPPSKVGCKAPTYIPPPSDPTPPSYIPPPSYENGTDPGKPIFSSPPSSPPSSSSSNGSTISNSTIPTVGATNTSSAGGTFSSLTGVSTTGGCACLTQATSITTIIQTYNFTVTSVLTQVTIETATVTVQTVNLVGVSGSTPLTAGPAPTTLVISTVGVSLNSSSMIGMSGGVANTTMGSRTTGGVGSSVSGSLRSYVAPTPTPWGVYGSPSGDEGGESGYGSQPLSYDQPSDGNDGDGDNGYGALPSNGGEEGSSEDGSNSDVDSGEYEGDTSAPDSENSGSESEEQSGGSSFLDWLLEILK